MAFMEWLSYCIDEGVNEHVKMGWVTQQITYVWKIINVHGIANKVLSE